MKIDELGTTVDILNIKVDGLTTTVDTLTIKVDGLVATVDNLAIATQQEFQSIRGEMATKEELKLVLQAIESVDIHLSAYASRANDDIATLQELTQEHDGRLRVLEKGK
jgi:outer membrane murein-binding lipoprotein Lpp